MRKLRMSCALPFAKHRQPILRPFKMSTKETNISWFVANVTLLVAFR
jgi:hypothetical protein